MCIAMLMSISACAESPQALPVVIEQSSTASPAEVSDPGPLCEALNSALAYEPNSNFGGDFSGSSLNILSVKGDSRVVYASKPEKIELPSGDATLQLAYEMDADRLLQLTLCFELQQFGEAYAYVGPIRTQGGDHPVLLEIFTANADADAAEEVIALVAWKVDSVLRTHGAFFELNVFDVPDHPGVMSTIEIGDPDLMFGFHGFVEGEPVNYSFKDAEAIRAKLKELGY